MKISYVEINISNGFSLCNKVYDSCRERQEIVTALISQIKPLVIIESRIDQGRSKKGLDRVNDLTLFGNRKAKGFKEYSFMKSIIVG